MKHNIIYSALVAAFAIFAMPSCMDYDEPADEFLPGQIVVEDSTYHGNPDHIDFNREITKAGVDSAKKRLEIYLQQAITGQYALRGGKNGDVPGAHAYQRQFSLATDIYAQYITVPHFDFMYGTLTSSYAISQEFNAGPNSSYLIVKNAVAPIINHPLVDSIPELKAVYLLMYDLASQEVADIYGPFPYDNFKVNQQKAPFAYNSLEHIYTKIVENIDTIVACLQHFEQRPDWYKDEVAMLMGDYTVLTREFFDVSTGFDIWIRFANSLKLRLAIHTAKVNPALAQKWAEEAVASGVVEKYAQEIVVDPMLIGFDNPLVTIWNTWNDARLSASFESLLHSLNHPYLYYVFAPNHIDIVNSQTGDVLPAESKVVGLREGIKPGQGQSDALNRMLASSRFYPDAISPAPLYIFKLSEVLFMRAEGALRGWNMGGDAKTFYEEGIRHASLDPRAEDYAGMTPYLEMMNDYMAQETPVDYTYIDHFGITPNMPSVTKIGVKWNDGDSNEIKLEKIITQKYIAAFPFSFEPWTDMRRTGYPKMFPVLNADEGDGTLRTGDLIRRMVFPNTDDSSVRDIEATGLEALGGEDWQSTRLWWDVEGSNF